MMRAVHNVVTGLTEYVPGEDTANGSSTVYENQAVGDYDTVLVDTPAKFEAVVDPRVIQRIIDHLGLR